MKRIIPTKAHGMIDYATAGALVTAPEILRLKKVPLSGRVARLMGLAATGYSGVTDYELGVRPLISMRTHLALDAAGGALLAASPWLFRFAGRGTRHWLPHVLVGTMELVVAFTSKTSRESGEEKPADGGE